MPWVNSQLRRLNKSIVQIMGFYKKAVPTLGNYCLNLYFLLHVPVLLWHLLQCSWEASKGATSCEWNPLLTIQGPLQKKEMYEITKLVTIKEMLGKVIKKMWLTAHPEQDLGDYPYPCPWNISSDCLSCTQRLLQRHSLERVTWEHAWKHLHGICDWT